MDVREKLVELLEETGMVENENRCNIIAEELIANGVTVQEDCKACAEATQNCIVKLQEQIAELRSVQEWISVKDRLPENRDDVLVCRTWWNETRNPHIGWYNDVAQEWQILDSDGYYPCGKVTYWMPLPQPPKGE